MDYLKLKEIVEQCTSYKEVIEKLELNKSGTNHKSIKKLITQLNIDTSHFLTASDRMRLIHNQNKISLDEILISGSTFNRGHLKKRLYNEGLKEPKCEMVGCGQDENWLGNKISLILDHINGINDDNRIENLRIVCPNCNAALPTHCGGNIKTKKINNKKTISELLISFESRRIVERPTYEQLIKDIKQSGYVKTGKKYGVSDNAIRKWKKFYEKF